MYEIHFALHFVARVLWLYQCCLVLCCHSFVIISMLPCTLLPVFNVNPIVLYSVVKVCMRFMLPCILLPEFCDMGFALYFVANIFRVTAGGLTVPSCRCLCDIGVATYSASRAFVTLVLPCSCDLLPMILWFLVSKYQLTNLSKFAWDSCCLALLHFTTCAEEVGHGLMFLSSPYVCLSGWQGSKHPLTD